MCSSDLQSGEERIQEAQKPLRLIEFLIRLTTRDGQTVLDPFMGSGTTAVSASRLKRHFIGFEIAPSFHNASLERLYREMGVHYAVNAGHHVQQTLFEKPKRRYRS